jgi:hypothetical protein
MKTCVSLLIVSMLLFSVTAFAQADDEEREPAAVVELGGVPNWSLTDPGSSLGPTIAVEFTPVKNWLEIETGVTSLFGRRSTEWSVDFLFKKPWDLTRTIEFMVGIGPEWVNTRRNGGGMNSLAGELVLDFMFWTSAKHKIGWYFEPSYDYSFRAGHERSMGASIGLLIGIPPRRVHSN